MIAEGLSRSGLSAYVFTATDYGGALIQELPHLQVYSQRLKAHEMVVFMKQHHITRVVDATHPYAREVTANIMTAAKESGVEYLRVIREDQAAPMENFMEAKNLDSDTFCASGAQPIVRVGSAAEAVAYLTTTQGTVFLTTGSKELDVFCTLPDFQKRLFVRVLPMVEVVERCFSLGLSGKQIIAMQGPFSYALNAALLAHCGCRYLVTKNTARAGGLDEKIQAALDNNITIILIERPTHESGFTLKEIFTVLGIEEDGAE